jgi:RND family efflux transporter MFP subunit
MKTILRILLPVIVVALGVAGFALLKSNAPVDPPLEPSARVWSVTAVSVEYKHLSPTLRLYGRVESPRETRLRSAVPADVMELTALSGRVVSKGELLLRLDDHDLKLILRQRNAEVADIKAQIESEKKRHGSDLTALKHEHALYDLAERVLKRAERLAQSQAGTQARVDEAQRALRLQALALTSRQRAVSDHTPRLAQLDARLNKSKAVRDQVHRDLQRSELTAPFDGRITAVHVSPGDRVRPGDRLIDLFDTNFVELRAQVPNRYLSTLRQALNHGNPVTATIELNGNAIQLELDRLAGKIERGQGGVDAFFNIIGKKHLIELGRTVSVFVDLPEEANVFALPATAVYGANNVYRIQDNRLSMVQIERVGDYRNGQWGSWILYRSKNLSEGDMILANQLPNAVEGLKVDILTQTD